MVLGTLAAPPPDSAADAMGALPAGPAVVPVDVVPAVSAGAVHVAAETEPPAVALGTRRSSRRYRCRA